MTSPATPTAATPTTATPTTAFRRTEEQELLAKTARRFLDEQAPSDVVRRLMDQPVPFDRELWDASAALGWTALAVPEEYGGYGYSMAELAVVFEEVGRAVHPGPLLASAVLATSTILLAGSDDQKRALLPDIASGQRIATVAFGESTHDAGVTSVATTATRDGDDWVLHGTKSWVLDAEVADLIVIAARAEDSCHLFAVPRSAPGLNVTVTPALDATRSLATVELVDVRVLESDRLGAADVDAVVARVLDLAAIALAAEQVGVAQRCLEVSVEFARTRFQFGRAIGSFQAIKHRLADMLLRTEHARSVAVHAAQHADDPSESVLSAALAGTVCSDAATWVSGEAIQVHGGIGFTWEHDAHLWFKRAKSNALLLRSPAEHRRRLAYAIGL